MSVRRFIFYSAKYLTFKGEILLRKRNQGRHIQLTRKCQRCDMVKKKTCRCSLPENHSSLYFLGEICQDLSGRSSKISEFTCLLR